MSETKSHVRACEKYPLLENVPEEIVLRARQYVAKRVNWEARWYYMSGKGDEYSVMQAIMEAIMTERLAAPTAKGASDAQP